jgi:hypothetical protein
VDCFGHYEGENEIMNIRSRLLTAAVAWALTAGAAQSQSIGVQGAGEGGITPDAAGCTHNFSVSNLAWCLSSTGNLQKLNSPTGAEHIAVGQFLEGYAICINNVPVYFDRGQSGGTAAVGFGAPVVLAGPTSSGMTIARNTTDNRYRLEQQWSRDKNERDLTVEMTLTNLTALPVGGLRLVRIVDVDANSNTIALGYDRSARGTWIRNVDAVSLQALTLKYPASTAITTFAVADGNPFPCNPPSIAPLPGSGNDVAAYVFYDLGVLAAGKKAIVKVGYQVH